MPLDEIVAARDRSEPPILTRNAFEVPELTHGSVYYPFGFPTDIRTNCPEILAQAHDLWSSFQKQFDTAPIRVDVHVQEGGSEEPPPPPVTRIMNPLLIWIVNTDNYAISNTEQGTTQIVLSRAIAMQPLYLRLFLLWPSPLCHISTRFATPVHAGCVMRNGRGILLCGESGAGKSSLSYACARAGWTFVSDDLSFFLNNQEERLVTGNCHQIRFRPSAEALFPELKGLASTPRASGKPSIELPTAVLPGMSGASTAQVDYLVFLNRSSGKQPGLVPYRRDFARHSIQKELFGSAESLAMQYRSLEQLLRVDVLELRYSDLDWAVDRLEKLAQEGR
jgi:hypothetical protein